MIRATRMEQKDQNALEIAALQVKNEYHNGWMENETFYMNITSY